MLVAATVGFGMFAVIWAVSGSYLSGLCAGITAAVLSELVAAIRHAGRTVSA